MKDMDTMLPDKYTGFEDPRLKVSDNGGFILEYTGVYKPKGAKPLDNVQRDWGRTMVFSSDQAEDALSMLLKMSKKK